MGNSLIYAIAAGVALALIFIVVRVALRWAVRLALVGLLLVALLGGLAWWWLNRPSQSETSPHSTPTRRTTSDRR